MTVKRFIKTKFAAEKLTKLGFKIESTQKEIYQCCYHCDLKPLQVIKGYSVKIEDYISSRSFTEKTGIMTSQFIKPLKY